MSPLLEEQLRRLLATSRSMLESARAGSRDGLAEKAAEHFKELQEALSEADASDSENLVDLMQELLQLNRDIMQGAVVEKNEIAAQLDEMRRGEAAKRGYGKYR